MSLQFSTKFKKRKKSKHELQLSSTTSNSTTEYINCPKCSKSLKVNVDSNSSNEMFVLLGHFRHCGKHKESHSEEVLQFGSKHLEECSFTDEPAMSSDDVNGEVSSPLDYGTDRSYYSFQFKLSESYLQKDIVIHKRPDQMIATKLEDTVDIFDFAVKHNLSTNGIEDLLQLFQSVHNRNKINISLPRNQKTLWRQCSAGIISSTKTDTVNGLFDILRWEYGLDQDIFKNSPDKIFAYSYDIKQIISEALLNMDPSKFIRNPDIRYTDTTHERIFEEYTTGLHFKRLSDAVQSESRYPNRVALCIGITLDDTQIRSGKRTFTPVYLYILNAIDNAFKMMLLGYAPGDKLPYSDKQIEDDLYELYGAIKDGKRIKKGKKTIALKIAKYHERQFQRDYLYDICAPILESQEDGVLLRVGSFNNKDGYEINACIHLCIISGDNLQIEFLTSTSLRTKFRKCRICMSKNCNSLDLTKAIGKFRSDTKMQVLGKRYGELLKLNCKKVACKKRSTEFIDCELKCKKKVSMLEKINLLIYLHGKMKETYQVFSKVLPQTTCTQFSKASSKMRLLGL